MGAKFCLGVIGRDKVSAARTSPFDVSQSVTAKCESHFYTLVRSRLSALVRGPHCPVCPGKLGQWEQLLGDGFSAETVQAALGLEAAAGLGEIDGL